MTRIRKRLVTLAAATAVVVAQLAAGLAFTPAAAASGTCLSTSSNYFDGGYTTSPNYETWGLITDRPVSLCSGTAPQGSAGTAWIMLSGGGASQYAQIGFARLAGMSAAMRFTEYNDGTNTPPGWARTFYSGFSSGTDHSYGVVYSFTTGKVSMSVDGSSKATTPWAADTSWSPGWNGQVFGETVNLGDDVPGTSTAKTHFSSIQWRPCRGCSLGVPTWAWRGSYASYYKLSSTTFTNDFYVWTQR